MATEEKQQQNKTQPAPPPTKKTKKCPTLETDIQSIPLVEHQDSNRSYVRIFVHKLEWKQL